MIAATFLPSAIIPQSAFAVTPATTATAATVKSDDTTSVDYATWADVAKAMDKRSCRKALRNTRTATQWVPSPISGLHTPPST